MSVLQDQQSSSISATWKPHSVFPAILISSTYSVKNNPCFRWTNKHSQFGTFSIQVHPKTSSNCVSFCNPADVQEVPRNLVFVSHCRQFPMNEQAFRIRPLLPIQVPSKLPRTVFPTKDQQVGVRTIFIPEEPLDLQMLDHDLGHLCRGRRVHISRHSDKGNFNNFGASFHFYLGVGRYCIPLLDLRTLAVWIWYPMTFAAVMCDADDPCSVNTA